MANKSKKNINTSMLYWRRLWREEVRGHWPQLLGILALVLVVAGTTSLYPLAIQWIFERFEQRDVPALQIAPLLIIGVTMVKSIFFYLQSRATNGFVIGILRRLQTRMFSVLMAREAFVFSPDPSASYAGRFTTDLTYVRDALLKLITGLLRDSFTVVALVGALFYIDWKLAIVAMCILPFAVLPVQMIGKRLRRVAASTQAQVALMMAFVTESLYALKTIKAYNMEPAMVAQAAQKFATIEALQLKAVNRRAALEPILEVLGGLAVAGVVGLVAWRVSSGQGALGTFTGFVSALLLAAQAVRGLGNLHLHIQEGGAALERVFAVIDTQDHVEDAQNAQELKVNSGEIQFEDVAFSYGGANALEGLSFIVPAGKTAALVGRSGAGKSTIFTVLMRMADVNSGCISIDGHDIRAVTRHSLRGHIAYVGQEAVLLDGTIEDNIRFGNVDASFEAVEMAAQSAFAHEFITQLPMGYQSYVGDRGGKLSGGQRQRISLARAFLKNAPILLLDEATSALDAESEHAVQAAIAQLSHGKTMLVIAHKLATIRAADVIFVLDEGRILQHGTHQKLMNEAGLYQDFLIKQAV